MSEQVQICDLKNLCMQYFIWLLYVTKITVIVLPKTFVLKFDTM